MSLTHEDYGMLAREYTVLAQRAMDVKDWQLAKKYADKAAEMAQKAYDLRPTGPKDVTPG
jgi:hypothetical protein